MGAEAVASLDLVEVDGSERAVGIFLERHEVRGVAGAAGETDREGLEESASA